MTPDRKTVWQQGALSLIVTGTPDDDYVRQIATTWFNGNGTAYQRRDVAAQLARFERPQFLSLRDSDSTIGSYLLDTQRLRLRDQQIDGYYRGLLTLAHSHRGRGLGQVIVREGARLLLESSERSGRPGISYGCVDAGNARARQLLAAHGMRPLGTLATRLHYRQFKRRQLPGVRHTLSDAARARWQTQVGRDSLQPDGPAFGDWVSVEDGRGNVVACRYHLTELCLDTLTGLSGFVVEKLMPWFPPGRRRFDPRRFRYVSISDPVATPGSDALARRLVEHLMVEHDTHFVALTSPPPDVFAQPPGAVLLRTERQGATKDLVIIGRTFNFATAFGSLTPPHMHLTARDL